MGVFRLRQSRAKGRDQIVRQVFDEAHSVRDQDLRTGLRHEHPNGRIQGRKELIGDVDGIVRERAHQAGLARIGVSDEGDRLGLARS